MSAKKLKHCKKSTPSEMKTATSDIHWDRLVKTVESIKSDTDKKLEEISHLCLNREFNDK